ncbi:ISL3 family transposase [Nitriliruptoraceae bacterium ZYF776]|nr:ISL3 family transposase [Profundirhabdus halotolerans]
MLVEPTLMCRALVGLADVEIVGVIAWTVPMQVHIASTSGRPDCSSCGTTARVKQTLRRRLVDLPCFGRPTVTVWRQRRWRCPAAACPVGSWTEIDERIVIGNRGMTDRAARWACEQVGRHGRTVAEVAGELGCDWHTVNRAVIGYGLALVDDPDRIGPVTVLGLDETAFVRIGPYRHRLWSTQMVGDGQLLDVVQGRDAAPACNWLAQRPADWRASIGWVTLDLSGSYRSVANTMLPHATQVADPFHVVRVANERLDEVRRRVQNETLGHRGHKSDPLYRTRRLLVMADERLDERTCERRRGLLAAGDPRGHVADAWQAKEAVREIYRIGDPEMAEAWVDELAATLDDRVYSPELRRLGRTLKRWGSQIAAWHRSRASNGPVEAVNNLAKRVKRVAFGITNWTHWRVRVLLYAGKPDWSKLATITPAAP